MKLHLKEKRPIILIEMEILKTTVGHHLKQLFPENVAFIIAAFLVEDQEGNTAKEQYKLLCASLYGMTQKGKNEIRQVL